MKRLTFYLFVFGLALIPLGAKAQLYVGIGLQAGFSSMPNADFPIDRYNDRAFLYRRMNRFHWPFGEIYDVSYRAGRVYLDLNLNTRRMRATAKSTDASGIYQRDVRFTMQALSLGAGIMVSEKEKFVMYLGGAIDGGYMRLTTRQGPSNQINRINYSLVGNIRKPMVAISAFAKMVFRSSPDAISCYSLTPYIQRPLMTYDFITLEQLLNQGSLQPYNQPLPGRPWNVGVAFNFDLDLIGFLVK